MVTTIKVSSSTRDRVNAIGAQTRQTADQVVDSALREYERSLFWQEFGAAAEAVAADPVAAADEVGERGLWEFPTRDGVESG